MSIKFIKKTSGTFPELAANYGFRYDKRNRAFMPGGSIISFDQSTPLAADRRYLANNFNTSIYKSISENVMSR